MPKEELLVASTEPVDLDDDKTTASGKDTTKDSSTNAELTKSDSKGSETLKTETEKKETKEETSKKDKTESKKDKTESKKDKSAETAKTTTEAKLTEESTEDAPPPPARPLSPVSRVKKDLKDAFPQIEDKYIQAVLIASQGQPDPAFNALLYLLDPTFVPEITPVAPPPVPPKQHDLTDDELLARKLQREFEKEDRRRRGSHQRRKNAPPPSDDESPDEIEQLKESFTQGFEEAKSTINGWVLGLSRKFSQENQQGQNRNQSPKLFGALGGSSFNQNQHAKRFDEDPEILSLDFQNKVNVHNDKPPLLPKRSSEQRERKLEQEEHKWQPLNSDVPVTLDAFLVTDLEEEEVQHTSVKK